ncbi:MAG: hypothetical protein M1473_10885, partial [Firmicutes bacterium]|nr:hypothetical protein [Bacillota bacterium]
DESLRHTCVAALSANAMEKDVQRGLDQGFDAYLTKPLAVEVLYDLLQHIEAKYDDASSS